MKKLIEIVYDLLIEAIQLGSIWGVFRPSAWLSICFWSLSG